MKFSVALVALATFASSAEAGIHGKRAKHFGRANKHVCAHRSSAAESATAVLANATESAVSSVVIVTSTSTSTVPFSTFVAPTTSVHPTSVMVSTGKVGSSTVAASTSKVQASSAAATSVTKAATTSSKVKATSSSSTAASATSVSLSSSTTKRGLGFNDIGATTAFGTKVSWAYNWDSTKSGSLASGVEYVPMLWGTSSDHTSAWTTHANAAISSGSTHLLGFNEPDLSSQSNLSPSAAAAAWKTYMEPFAGKAKLVSPAITNGAAPMGTAWLDDFLSACSGCTIDAIAIHIYDAASNTAYFQNYISDIGTKYGKPVWVTEFGATGSTSDQQTFLETMLPFLDGLSSVERYSYFGDFSGTFVDSSNKLLALGETYASA